MRSIVPRDETIHQLQVAPPITKIHAYSEQICFHIDLLLLSNQIKSIQNSIHKFQSDFSTSNEKKITTFLVTDVFLAKQINEHHYIIQPKDAEEKFNQEST